VTQSAKKAGRHWRSLRFFIPLIFLFYFCIFSAVAGAATFCSFSVVVLACLLKKKIKPIGRQRRR